MEIPNPTDPDIRESKPEDEDVDQKRLELVRLSESGEITQSVKAIRKASNNVINKIHAEYEQKQADNANTFLADALITKFAELMSALDVVDPDDELSRELRSDILLQKNVKKALSFITPWLPFIGVISGGATLGKHVMKHRGKPQAE